MNDSALELPAFQQWFLAAITHPTPVGESLLDGVRLGAPPAVANLGRKSAAEMHEQGLEIYRRGYFSRLVECLADDYPALQHALGLEGFETLCHRYIVAYPSREPNLNGFGRHLPRFVEEQAPEVGRFAADLARLEWALVEVLHAPAPEAFSAEALAALANERLEHVQFTPSPALRLHTFAFPVNEFLQAFFDGRAPVAPDREPSTVAIVREGYRIWRFGLGPTAAVLLRRLVEGQPLGLALVGIDASVDQVHAWFREWTAHAFFQSATGEAPGGTDPWLYRASDARKINAQEP